MPELNAIPRVDQDSRHFESCHERWLRRRHRNPDSPNYEDQWYGQQCGGCGFFVRLRGVFQEDWGACTNAVSPCDGTARFEHDGCSAFTPAIDGW